MTERDAARARNRTKLKEIMGQTLKRPWWVTYLANFTH